MVAVARNSGANPTVGPALLLPALAAAYLGATAFRRGFNPLGTVVGVLLVAFTVSGFTLGGHRAVGEGRDQRHDAAGGGGRGGRPAPPLAPADRRQRTPA